MRVDMFEKTIGQETEQLLYLKLAEQFGFHITDFMDHITEEEFANQHLFYYFKPVMYDIMRSSGNLYAWGPSMKEAFAVDFKIITSDISIIFRQAEELDEDSNIETVCSYIGTNEYVFYCYERLVKYVQRFYSIQQLEIGDKNDC